MINGEKYDERIYFPIPNKINAIISLTSNQIWESLNEMFIENFGQRLDQNNQGDIFAPDISRW